MRSSLSGFKEAAATMASLSKAVQRGVGKRALIDNAEFFAGKVKAAAPVSTDPHNKTPGSLRDSTKVDRREKSRKGRPRVSLIADDVAAVPNEFGTSKMTAQPYFRPAVDRNRRAGAVRFGEALKVEVDAAARRAAKRGGA